VRQRAPQLEYEIPAVAACALNAFSPADRPRINNAKTKIAIFTFPTPKVEEF
jgi:hypothetical protein